MAPPQGGSPKARTTFRTPSFDPDKPQNTASFEKRKIKRKVQKTINLEDPEAIEIYYTDEGCYETVFIDPMDMSPRGPRLIVSAKSIRTLQHMYKMTSTRSIELTELLDQCRNAFFKELQYLREQLESPQEKDLNVFFFDPSEYFADKETSEILRAEVLRRTFPLQTEINRLKKQLKLAELNGGSGESPSIKTILNMLQEQTKVSDLVVILANLPNADEEAFKQMLFVANHKLGIGQNSDKTLNEIREEKSQADEENNELKAQIAKLKEEVKTKTDMLIQFQNEDCLALQQEIQGENDRVSADWQTTDVVEEMEKTDPQLTEARAVIESLRMQLHALSHDQESQAQEQSKQKEHNRLADENAALVDENATIVNQLAESKEEHAKERVADMANEAAELKVQMSEQATTLEAKKQQNNRMAKADNTADDASREAEFAKADIQVSQAVDLCIQIVKEHETFIEDNIFEELNVLQEMFGTTFHNFQSILRLCPVDSTKSQDAISQLDLFLQDGVEASYKSFVKAREKERDRSAVDDPAKVSRALASCDFPNPPQYNDVLTTLKHLKGAMRSFQHKCFGFVNVVASFLSQLKNVVIERLGLPLTATAGDVETKVKDFFERTEKEVAERVAERVANLRVAMDAATEDGKNGDGVGEEKASALKHEISRKSLKVEHKTIGVWTDPIVICDEDDAGMAKGETRQRAKRSTLGRVYDEQVYVDGVPSPAQTDLAPVNFSTTPREREENHSVMSNVETGVQTEFTLEDFNDLLHIASEGTLKDEINQMIFQRRYCGLVNHLKERRPQLDTLNDKYESAVYCLRQEMPSSSSPESRRRTAEGMLETSIRSSRKKNNWKNDEFVGKTGRESTRLSMMERPSRERGQATAVSEQQTPSPLAADRRQTLPASSDQMPAQTKEQSSVDASHALVVTSVKRPSQTSQEFPAERLRQVADKLSVERPRQTTRRTSVEGTSHALAFLSVESPSQAAQEPSVERPIQTAMVPSANRTSHAQQFTSVESPRSSMHQFLAESSKHAAQQSLVTIPKPGTTQQIAHWSSDEKLREAKKKRLIERSTAGVSRIAELRENERSCTLNAKEPSPSVPPARNSYVPVMKSSARESISRIPDADCTSGVTQRFSEGSASHRFRSSSAHHSVDITSVAKVRTTSNQLHRATLGSIRDADKGLGAVPWICKQRIPFLFGKSTGLLRPETHPRALKLVAGRMNAPTEKAVKRGRMTVSRERASEAADFSESDAGASIEPLDTLPCSLMSETEGRSCGYERSKLLHADHIRRERRTKKLDLLPDRLSKSHSDFTGTRTLGSLGGLRTITPGAFTAKLFVTRSTIHSQSLSVTQHLNRDVAVPETTDIARVTAPEFQPRSKSKGREFGKARLARDRSWLPPLGAYTTGWANSSFSRTSTSAQGQTGTGRKRISPLRSKQQTPLQVPSSPSRTPTLSPKGRASERGISLCAGNSSHRGKHPRETFSSLRITQLVESTRKRRETAGNTRDRMPAAIQLLLADVDKMLDAPDAEGKMYASLKRRKKKRSEKRLALSRAARSRSTSPPPDLSLMVPSPREKNPRRMASRIFPPFARASGMRDRSIPHEHRV